MKREKNQIVQLSKIRIRETLRAKLEKAARQAGASINSEIERRLEASFRDDGLAEIKEMLRRVHEILEPPFFKTDAVGEYRVLRVPPGGITWLPKQNGS